MERRYAFNTPHFPNFIGNPVHAPLSLRVIDGPLQEREDVDCVIDLEPFCYADEVVRVT